jgi:hypothetical protein
MSPWLRAAETMAPTICGEPHGETRQGSGVAVETSLSLVVTDPHDRPDVAVAARPRVGESGRDRVEADQDAGQDGNHRKHAGREREQQPEPEKAHQGEPHRLFGEALGNAVLG